MLNTDFYERPVDTAKIVYADEISHAFKKSEQLGDKTVGIIQVSWQPMLDYILYFNETNHFKKIHS